MTVCQIERLLKLEFAEILLNAGRINPCVVPVQLENPETPFGRNVLQIIQNITGYLYKLVPTSESMELSLTKLPKAWVYPCFLIVYPTVNSEISTLLIFH